MGGAPLEVLKRNRHEGSGEQLQGEFADALRHEIAVFGRYRAEDRQ